MPAFDELKSAAFDGVSFNVVGYTIRGGMRDHVHEFPHAPGGLAELLGRKPYVFELAADFSENDRFRSKAWSQTLPELRQKFEQGLRSDLYIPTLGTIDRAYCMDWDQTFNAKRRDGEPCRFVFREDMQQTAIVGQNVTTTFQYVAALAGDLSFLINEEALDPDFFSAVMTAVTDITAIVDTVELQGSLLASKAESIAAACREIDETLEIIKEPPHWRVARALRDLGAAAVGLHQDLLRKLGPMFIFPVPRIMTITEVSRAMYGTADKQVDLLKLNGFDDPYEIPAGFEVRGYLLDKLAA